MRWFLTLSYRGAPFHGWQRQPNATSVQQTLEEALGRILRTPTEIVGAGRTDTGVNARLMTAHFNSESVFDPDRLVKSLNHLTGPDIVCYDVRPVRPDAHARFDATARTYKYFITREASPFLYPLAWHCPSRLDIEKMNEAAAILLETEDFTSFSKLHTDVKTNICNVTEARWEELDLSALDSGHSPLFTLQTPLCFTITADRFLRNMVRAVVGTLLDVGRGKLNIQGFRNVIEEKDRCSAGQSVPGHALYLWDIRYPEEIFID